MYKHGIETDRKSNSAAILDQATLNVQVAIGTAPINLLADPQSAVNKLFVCKNIADVMSKVGYSSDFSYTLNQSAYASFSLQGCAPIVLINVLDPTNTRHITAVSSTKFTVTNLMTRIAVMGVLINTLIVKSGDKTGVAGTDYIATFDDDGYVNIAITPDGNLKNAVELDIAYTKLNPAGVTSADIIGGVDENGVRTGISLIDEIYSTLNIVPGILTAPGYSSTAQVVAALEAKAELSGDIANAIAVIDIDSATVKKKEDVANAKQSIGAGSRWLTACWPKVLVGTRQMYMSAVLAAKLQKLCQDNNNVPQSPDNKELGINGTVLADGTEIHLLINEINDYLNANGVVSAVYINGWKAWGNNTCAYPLDTDANDRFIKCVMMGNYIENRFKTEYLSSIGTDANYKLVDSIVMNFNAELSALVPDYLAGVSVVFNKDDNPASEIQQGHFKFETRYADYTPTEYISNTFVWDIDILSNVLGGE